jgi:hypothetical protein
MLTEKAGRCKEIKTRLYGILSISNGGGVAQKHGACEQIPAQAE